METTQWKGKQQYDTNAEDQEETIRTAGDERRREVIWHGNNEEIRRG